MSDGMGTTPLYDWAALALSAAALVLSLVYLRRVARTYQLYHDERAAVSLAKATGLAVVAGGLLASASGLVLGTAALSIAGLSIARGAFLVLIITLVLADVRPAGKD